MDVIDALQPDLIIGNKEENEQSQIEALAAKYPDYISDIKHLEDAIVMISKVGTITNVSTKAQELMNTIKRTFSTLAPRTKPQTCAYFIWKDLYIVVGEDTYISDMLKKADFQNVFDNQDRYRTINLEELAQKSHQYILLSSEPFPITHKDLFQEICPNATIKIVDSELFSWYGSYLLLSLPYFQSLRQDTNNKHNDI